MALDDRAPARVSKGALREIRRQTTRAQREYLNSATSDYRPRTMLVPDLKAIVTSTTITACSGTTPGTGTATIYYWDGSSVVADPARTDVGVKNWFTTYTPASGDHITLTWQDNAYWLGPGDCSTP